MDPSSTPQGTPDPACVAGEAGPIEASILALTRARGSEKSICPSEVARALLAGSEQASWQSLMAPVRQAAIRLAKAGRIEILRKGRPVAPGEVRGVIRLRARDEAAGGGDAP